MNDPAAVLHGQPADQARGATFLGKQPRPFGDRNYPKPPNRVTVQREAGQIRHRRPEEPGRIVEQEHPLVSTAEREGRRLVIPADAVPGAEPGHCAPRVSRQPQEHQRGYPWWQRSRDRELDPAVLCRVVDDLFDDRHPLRAHSDRGQYRVRPAGSGRALGDPDRRPPALRAVPVVRARAEARGQVRQRRLLELTPARGRVAPLPELAGAFHPRTQPLDGVVKRPAEWRLADNIPAVAGHAAAGVGPAGNDGEHRAPLKQRDAVALLEPQRLQRGRVQGRPAARVTGAGRGHKGRLSGVDPRWVAGAWGAYVVGYPGGGDQRRLVAQVRGRDGAVELDRQPSAAVRAQAVQQRDDLRERFGTKPHNCHIINIVRLPSVIKPLRSVDIGRPALHFLPNGVVVSRPPRHLADLELAERRRAVAELGEREFRADQLSRHYFGRYTDSPADMTDLPATLRSALAARLLPRLLISEREQACDNGATRKMLWRLHDGALVESVLMKYPDRVTMCVSSQAGCGMGCPFCATGQAGLTRNLSAAEIVDQVVAGQRALQAANPTGPSRPNSALTHTRVSNIVFMGMGEPLANYRNVVAAVRRLTDPVPSGLGISQRSVTVSTIGLVPAIGRLAAEGLSVTLAVSLHAPDDEARDELVPVNRRWKVAEVLAAAWDYAAATGRRISIEYALIRDVNDQPWRADLLGSMLAGHLVHVNLIPLNPTPGSKWTASRPGVQEEFVRCVAGHGVAVTVRDTRGREIDGACGQLAATVTGRSVGPARRARGAVPAGLGRTPRLDTNAPGVTPPSGAVPLPFA